VGHIAGAARGSYNERFAAPSRGDMFRPTRFPFTDADEADTDAVHRGLQSAYRPEQRLKVFYTNTPVEYWGGGREAALTHTSVEGTRRLPRESTMHTVPFIGLALCSWRRLSDFSVCHILGWRYLASLLRSVVKSETPEQTIVDRVILSDDSADWAGTSHSSL
jgi:hypothetical protein